jgi:NitT/TauT family transport system substrate-binding protein
MPDKHDFSGREFRKAWQVSNPRSRTRSGVAVLLAMLSALGLLMAACGSSSSSSATDTTVAVAELPTSDPVTVRLGYFPNVTHAPALVGIQEGLFTQELEPLGATLAPQSYNAGPEATEALFGDALDITYIGPSPAANAYQKSDGEAVRIIAGSTSGGAKFVVKSDITSAADLKGKTVSSPQLGNTQDVALRAWLSEQGLTTDTTGGGDVSIKPQANADILTAFQNDEIVGAWVPTPWDTRLVEEAGGKVLVDEADLWPDGQFATTEILVRTKFLEQHPAAVAAILRGHIASIGAIAADPTAAQAATNKEIEVVTGKPVKANLLAASFDELSFTFDPLAATVKKSADNAVAAGLSKEFDLTGLFDLSLLNQILAADGKATVQGL